MILTDEAIYNYSSNSVYPTDDFLNLIESMGIHSIALNSKRNHRTVTFHFKDEFINPCTLFYYHNEHCYFVCDDISYEPFDFIESLFARFGLLQKLSVLSVYKDTLCEHFFSYLFSKALSYFLAEFHSSFSFENLTFKEQGSIFINLTFDLVNEEITFPLEARLSISDDSSAFFLSNSFTVFLFSESLLTYLESNNLHLPFYHSYSYEQFFKILFRNILIDQFKSSDEYRVLSIFNPSISSIS